MSGPVPWLPAAVGVPLSWCYGAAVRLRNAWWAHRTPLEARVPVVSVGNLVVGGSGKSPMVRWIAERLAASGRHPAIALRGYRRSEDPRLPAGDEAAEHARLLPGVPLAVGADRSAAIAALLARSPAVDVVVLDDGFQHRRLARRLDVVLVDATRAPGGALVGGRIVLASNSQISDFSLVQYFGNGPRPADAQWKSGAFMLNNQRMDYYDFVRASLSGGRLRFNPVQEIADLVLSNCADLSYRAEAIDISLAAGIQNRPQPGRLPLNIYGTEGDWETYSTPSRDARLKTAFKEVRDNAERFLTLWRARDPQIVYNGFDLAGDMLGAYDRAAARCTVSYKRTDGSDVRFGYEEARRRLFRFSFDPYHCVERRWGADNVESATCRDTMVKRRWYDAQQRLRNQLDRSYEAKMDFNLLELEEGRGGVAQPPDVDARAYLMSQRGR